MTVTPGTQVSIDIDVDANEDATVALALSGVPASWTAELHGGGYVVDAVFVDGNDPTTVRLDVDVPERRLGHDPDQRPRVGDGHHVRPAASTSPRRSAPAARSP